MTTQDMIDQATATLIAAANDLHAFLAALSPRRCPRCDGTGAIHEAPIHTDLGRVHFWGPCPDCNGTGKRAYAANDLAALLATTRSHSDLDLELRQSPATRCPSCGGQTGAYDGAGDWWPCSQCQGTGYRDGTPPGYDAIPF